MRISADFYENLLNFVEGHTSLLSHRRLLHPLMIGGSEAFN